MRETFCGDDEGSKKANVEGTSFLKRRKGGKVMSSIWLTGSHMVKPWVAKRDLFCFDSHPSNLKTVFLKKQMVLDGSDLGSEW